MTRIIEELLVDIQAFEFIRNERDPLPSDIEWDCTGNRAYLHKLLSLPRPDEHSSVQQCRTYCVVTTLLLVFCYECTYVSAVRSGKLVLARLEHFLRLTLGDFNQMEYNWGRQNDMLLWITVIGACVAEGGKPIQKSARTRFTAAWQPRPSSRAIVSCSAQQRTQ